MREYTFKLLFCNEFHEKSEMPKQYDLFLDNLENTVLNEEDRDYITKKVTDIINHKAEIDGALDRVSVGWTTQRMAKVDLTILRLEYYEMKMEEDIPQKVAIDQAVELAKKFGSDDSPSFVNGILAKIF